MDEGLSRPGPLQDVEQVLHLLGPGSGVDAEELVLLVAVAHPDHAHHTSGAHVVQDRQILRQTYRVVEKAEDGGHHNDGGLGAGSHGRRENQW